VSAPSAAVRARGRLQSLLGDRVSLVLCVVFVVGSAFYLWTAATSVPLALDGADAEPYNRLADAFLHLRVSVGDAPPGLVQLADPYDPAQNLPFQTAYPIHDLALYDGQLYATWGPVPPLVLLVPMGVFGLAPSSSLTAVVFAIAGLAFLLATLRVLLRHIGEAGTWLAALAALALACSSTIPFLLRRPAVYEGAIAGGFCFAAAGLWLATSVLCTRTATFRRLALISLCFGLAAGSRPGLVVVALVMVPIFTVLRRTLSPRRLLAALLGPLGACGVLLLAYNAVRFGSPLEVGQSYVLAGYNPRTEPYGDLDFVVPGLWFYLLSPPRPTVLFPFLRLAPPPVSYPGGLPAGYTGLEVTGGLLPMTPVLLFVPAVAWLRSRRFARLQPLLLGFAALIVAAASSLVFLSYEFFGTTQRYEVDFAPFLLLVGLAVWLMFSVNVEGMRRRFVRVGGAVLVVWGCLTGLAISFTGYYNVLAVGHKGTWTLLEDAGSPISTAIAMVAGRPVLAEVSAPNLAQVSPVKYTTLGAGVRAFSLRVADEAEITIVSPDSREAALVVSNVPGPGLPPRSTLSMVVSGPAGQRSSTTIERSANGSVVRVRVHLGRGLNRLVLRALVSSGRGRSGANAAQQPVLTVTRLTLSERG
jgi:hypothetical protein